MQKKSLILYKESNGGVKSHKNLIQGILNYIKKEKFQIGWMNLKEIFQNEFCEFM